MPVWIMALAEPMPVTADRLTAAVLPLRFRSASVSPVGKTLLMEPELAVTRIWPPADKVASATDAPAVRVILPLFPRFREPISVPACITISPGACTFNAPPAASTLAATSMLLADELSVTDPPVLDTTALTLSAPVVLRLIEPLRLLTT